MVFWIARTLIKLLAWLLQCCGRLLLIVLASAWHGLRRRWRGKPSTFGAARVAHVKEIVRAGALAGDGLILARIGLRLLRFNEPEGSVLVFAPQGAGKGVGIVIPNLLTYRGSVICTDPKGENFAVTGRRRQDFGPVWRVDLAEPAASHRFNPLDTIRFQGGSAVEDARRLADLLMPHDHKAASHWRERAVEWLAGILLAVAERHETDPKLRTLAEAHRLLSLPPSLLKHNLEGFQTSRLPKVRETAAQILRSLEVEETSNILSNMLKGTEIWGYGSALARVSSRSDLSLDTFYAQPQSLFLVVPEDLLSVYGGFLRVMVGLSMHALTRAGRTAPPPRHRPLLMLDECAALGYLRPLEAGMGYLRAYARAILIFQDVHQLEATYGKAKSIIANAAAQVAFRVNDSETARMLSERLGTTTVTSRSYGVSQA